MIIFKQAFFLLLFFCLNTNKIDAQTFNWYNNVGGSGAISSNAVAVDIIGNSYVIGGLFNSFYSIFISKYDRDGKLKWSKQAGSAGYAGYGDKGTSISVDSKGNTFITGFIYGLAKFGEIQLNLDTNNVGSAFIAKYDSNGNCLWAKQAYGIGSEHAFGISTDINGNCYMTGSFDNTAIFDTIHLTNYGSSDIFIAKYDPIGNCLWAKHAGGIGNDYGQAVSVDENNNCYITGGFSGDATFGTKQISSYGTNTDMFIVKYDANGNCLWVNHAGAQYGSINSRSISADLYGNTYLTGYFYMNAIFDSYQLFGSNYYDVFIAKYDPNGNCLWVRGGGGSNDDNSNSIFHGKNGNSYIIGYTASTSLVFGNLNLIRIGHLDYEIFIAKLDSSGEFLWAKFIGSENDDYGTGITCDENGSCYITGECHSAWLFGTIQFAAGPFIAKISYLSTDIKNEKTILKDYSLSQNYPNPFNPNTIISYSLPTASNIKLIVYNTLGQTIKVLEEGFKNAGNYSVDFNASELPSGIYFYRLEAGQFSQVKKMILVK